jgi:hypothetical protein
MALAQKRALATRGFKLEAVGGLDRVEAVELESENSAAALQIGGGDRGFVETVYANQHSGAFFAVAELHLQDLIAERLEDFFGNLFYV